MVKNPIKVYGRLKPVLGKTTAEDYEIRATSDDCETISFNLRTSGSSGKNENYTFRFQKIFAEQDDQEVVFNTVARPVVDSVLQGYNGTMFAYGQTGSGKTYAITGGMSHYDDRGIIPRTIQHIFQNFRESEVVHTTCISYLEIYNECGYDLLNPNYKVSRLDDLPKVTLLEDTSGNLHLRNLSVHPVSSEEEALNLLFLGDTNRVISETPMNPYSSRSHCVFTVHLLTHGSRNTTVRRSKLHIVDLAGSERVHKSGIEGNVLTEARHINLSLHFLEQVIVALAESKRAHVPYRNSMMTTVLRDSLGGNCMTAMLATLSVEKNNIEETLSTCRFAQRVALVRNEPQLNEERDPQVEISLLRADVRRLREQIAALTTRKCRPTSKPEENGEPSELAPEEVAECRTWVKNFLRNNGAEPPLAENANGPLADPRKVNLCFSLLRDAATSRDDAEGPFSEQPGSVLRNTIEMEVEKYKDIIKQRDSEISILVSLLRKDKTKAKCNVDLTVQGEGCTSERSRPLTPSAIAPSDDYEPLVERVTDAQSLTPEECIAFKKFIADRKNRFEIEIVKEGLRNKFEAAKKIAASIEINRDNMREATVTRRRTRLAFLTSRACRMRVRHRFLKVHGRKAHWRLGSQSRAGMSKHKDGVASPQRRRLDSSGRNPGYSPPVPHKGWHKFGPSCRNPNLLALPSSSAKRKEGRRAVSSRCPDENPNLFSLIDYPGQIATMSRKGQPWFRSNAPGPHSGHRAASPHTEQWEFNHSSSSRVVRQRAPASQNGHRATSSKARIASTPQRKPPDLDKGGFQSKPSEPVRLNSSDTLADGVSLAEQGDEECLVKEATTAVPLTESGEHSERKKSLNLHAEMKQMQYNNRQAKPGQPDNGRDAKTQGKLMALRAQLDSQQAAYRQGLLSLQVLKVETEHQKHAMEQAKLRLLHNFRCWWTGSNKHQNKEHGEQPPPHLQERRGNRTLPPRLNTTCHNPKPRTPPNPKAASTTITPIHQLNNLRRYANELQLISNSPDIREDLDRPNPGRALTRVTNTPTLMPPLPNDHYCAVDYETLSHRPRSCQTGRSNTQRHYKQSQAGHVAPERKNRPNSAGTVLDQVPAKDALEDLPRKLERYVSMPREASDKFSLSSATFKRENRERVSRSEKKSDIPAVRPQSRSGEYLKNTDLKTPIGNVRRINLTGDPEIDKEIIAFYEARNRVYQTKQ